MKIGAAVLVSLLALGAAIAAQRPQPSPQSNSYSAGVTAVLVDVVVRDKRGRPVVDLTADDFEIQEDQVPQKLGSFAVVERGGGIGITVGRRVSGPPAAAPESSPTETAALPPAADHPTVALVFDALRPGPLALAQKAALAYLPMIDGSEGRIGVFASEPGLRVLQRYTDNTSLVRKAVYSLMPAGTAKQEVEAERRQALNERLVTLDALGIGRDSLVFSAEGGNPTASQALVEQQMTELEMRMLRTFESLDRDHRGFGSSDALLSVIQSLAVMPGRKTLVYVSEGLPASPAMQARLDLLVSVANRANVSVYAIDAAGLRTESVLSETRQEVNAAAQERLRQNSVSRDPSNGPLMRLVERTEDLIRLDPHGGLARLAEDTGGFLIRDTNDLSSAFRRIDEDNRFHYLLTYTPSNADFDGTFRKIQVRVKRQGLQVFARKGYLAVRKAVAGFSYEAAALAALNRGRPPNDFPVSARGFVFPVPQGRAAVPLVVQVQTRHLRFHVDEAKGTYAAQAVIVANIRNAAGQTVHTLSQQYILSGAATDVEAARNGEILFYRQPDLPPGVYRLEAVVHDAIADRASARLSTLSVPAPAADRAPASTLALVRHIEKVPSGEGTANLPFFYGDLLLYPNAGEPLRRSRDAELTFYFAFYSAPGDQPSADLEILHGGRPVASVPVDLPRPLAGGRVQHVGKLPVDKFPPGTYELRLRLRTGDEEQLRTAFFTISQ